MPLRSVSDSAKSSDAYSGLFAPPLSSAHKSTTTAANEHKSTTETHSPKAAVERKGLPSQVIDLITPPRNKERIFGRELDANTKILILSPLRRSPRIHNTSGVVAREDLFLTKLTPIKSSITVEKTKETARNMEKRKPVLLVKQPDKQKEACNLGFGKPTTAQNIVFIESKINNNQLPAEPDTANSPPAPPKITAYFAKKPTISKALDIEKDSEDGVILNEHPSVTARICFCGRSADWFVSEKNKLKKSQAEKNKETQIAQCTNTDCRFRWYHYACLNLSDKAKARFGTLLCQHCRNEQEFVVKGRGYSSNTKGFTESSLRLSKDDIEAVLPGLGGHIPEAYPYGLGLEVDLGHAYVPEIQTQGTIGALEHFGYPQSHPYMMEEAYLNPEVYINMKARALQVQAENDEYWYATRTAADDSELLNET